MIESLKTGILVSIFNLPTNLGCNFWGWLNLSGETHLPVCQLYIPALPVGYSAFFCEKWSLICINLLIPKLGWRKLKGVRLSKNNECVRPWKEIWEDRASSRFLFRVQIHVALLFQSWTHSLKGCLNFGGSVEQYHFFHFLSSQIFSSLLYFYLSYISSWHFVCLHPKPMTLYVVSMIIGATSFIG